MVNKAIILSAGRGGRLSPLTIDRPKGLIKLGNKSIIEYQLDFLRQAGVSQIAVVVGHCAEFVKQTLGDQLSYFYNPNYKHTNSLYSFWVAREFIANEGTLVLNSDVLFHPQLLKNLLNAPFENALLIDFSAHLGEEEMKVITKDGIIKRISKNIPPDEAEGENVGIVKLSPTGAKALLNFANECVQNEEWNFWVPDAIDFLSEQIAFYALPTNNLPWIEIDYFHDLNRARHHILPQILSPEDSGFS